MNSYSSNLVTLLAMMDTYSRHNNSMAHLTKEQKRKIVAIRTDMVKYLLDLQTSVAEGDLQSVIEFCNGASVKIDVECLLNRHLSDSEATALLQTPEANKDAYGTQFGTAHAIALNMKNTRQLCRTLLRQTRIEGIGLTLAELLAQVEAFAR